MIRSLRRRHRRVVPAVVIVTAVLTMLAVANRRAVPTMPALPIGSSAGGEVTLGPRAGAVAVYWAPDDSPTRLGPEARLLGMHDGDRSASFRAPSTVSGAGVVKLYDLERQAIVAVIPLGGEESSWR